MWNRRIWFHRELSGMMVAWSLLLAACSTVSVKTDFDPKADFSKLHSYAWYPNKQDTNPDPLYNNSLLDQRIHKAVEAELQTHGFTQAPPGTPPDLFVEYRTRTQQKIAAGGLGLGLGYGYGPFAGYAGPGWSVSEYTEGTLILDFVDPVKNVLYWRGYATGAFDNPQISEDKLRDVVHKILEKYPPEKPKA